MTYKMEIPKDTTLDSSLQLLLEGYRFISNRRRKFQSDIFEVTLMGQKAICISGPEAAEVFYDETNFKRHGAPPKRIKKSIFGEGGVQTLDDEAHRKRKTMFMSLFTENHINELKELTTNDWNAVQDRWKTVEEVNLFEETKQVMCKIACKWAGVPLKETEVENRANDLWALVDAFGAVGRRHWRGRLARKRCDRWIGDVIHQVRMHGLELDEETPLYKIAWHTDLNNDYLDEKTAAVEVINIIRPIVAISLYVLFGALALHRHPKERERVKEGGTEYARIFTQEIRRFYPFTPFVGARVRKEFHWAGHRFTPNRLVLLDVYGMNHDHRLWDSPSEFKPERFKNAKLNEYDFIPQGGGEFIKNHRCGGELVT